MCLSRKIAYQDNYFHPCQCLPIWTDQTSAAPDLSSSPTTSATDNREIEPPEGAQSQIRTRDCFSPASLGHLVLKLVKEKKNVAWIWSGALAGSWRPHTPLLVLAWVKCHHLQLFLSSVNKPPRWACSCFDVLNEAPNGLRSTAISKGSSVLFLYRYSWLESSEHISLTSLYLNMY